MKAYKYVFIISVIALLLVTGCGKKDTTGQVVIEKDGKEGGIATFTLTGDELCVDDAGKPIVRQFSTSWCPHCKWIMDTYESVVEEYVADGKITAYLWELDTDDDLLTSEKDSVPAEEREVFEKYNPRGSIPTFVFGCQYVRVGNGYEQANDLASEEAEFRAVIEKLLEGQ